MPSILKVARDNNLLVIEDAAEALYSKLDGKHLGTHGEAGIISFSPNKTITTGQGGVVLLNDDNLWINSKTIPTKELVIELNNLRKVRNCKDTHATWN